MANNECFCDIQPIQPFIPIDEKERRDWELWHAIMAAIHMCGFNGEDVTARSIDVLRQIGRYDLLPQCDRYG